MYNKEAHAEQTLNYKVGQFSGAENVVIMQENCKSSHEFSVVTQTMQLLTEGRKCFQNRFYVFFFYRNKQLSEWFSILERALKKLAKL